MLRTGFTLCRLLTPIVASGAPRMAAAHMPPAQEDTARPPVPTGPLTLPADSSTTTRRPGGSPANVYYRNILELGFDDSTSGGTVRNVLARYNSAIIGGGSLRGITGGAYVIRVPDPGPTFDALQQLLSRLAAERGVHFVRAMMFGVRYDQRSRFPKDGPSTPPVNAVVPAAQQPLWPLLIDSFPKLDTTRRVRLPSGRWLYRVNITLRFKKTVSDSAKIRFFRSHGMTVVGVTRSGQFFVGVRDPGPSSDSLFGMLRRLKGEPEILVAASVNFTPLPHAQEESARPPVPSAANLPDDSTLTVPSPSGMNVRYYRNILVIVFHNSTSGVTVRRILAKYRGVIIGGSEARDDPGYYVRIPDPGTTFAAVDSVASLIETEPGVKLVYIPTWRGLIRIR